MYFTYSSASLLLKYITFLITYNALKQYKEAQTYCGQLLKLSKRLDPYDPDQASVLQPVIEFYQATRQYAMARKYLAIDEAFCEAVQNPLQLAKNHLLSFKLDSIQGKYLAAIWH